MSRRRKKSQIVGWLSADPDNNETSFIQAGSSLYHSEAYQSLPDGAKNLYLCMATESKGHRTFCFPASTAKKYGIATRSFWNYVSALENAGFILRESGRITREENIYHFSFAWKGIAPAAPLKAKAGMATCRISGQDLHVIEGP